MHPKRPAVMLVDPVKAGEGYKMAAHDFGLAIVSVYTLEPSVLWARWPDHGQTDDVSLYAQEAEQIRAQLAATDLAVKAVVPAMESAVYLTDVLAHELGLPGNDVALAWARRNKAAMRQHALRAGVRVPAFRLIHDLAEVPAAAAAIGYPAIVKQTMGAGARGVTLVRDAEEARSADFGESSDPFGWPIKEWLVERYVRGRELAVNCFSSDGDHRVIDMWDYRQPPGGGDYDFPLWNNVQVTQGDPDWDEIQEVVSGMLDAFGVVRGPSHTEVKVTPDGIYLIEIGARLPGGPAIDLWSDFSAIRPFHDALECYLGRRPAIMDGGPGFRASFGAIAIRNDTAPGTLVAVRGLAELESHPNVTKVLVGYRPGDHVPVTRELKTIPVGAWLRAPSQEAVVRTLAEIRSAVSLEIIPDHNDSRRESA